MRILPRGIGSSDPRSETVASDYPSIPDTADVSALRTAWWRILEDYTARALSFPQKDKLIALSAVASRLEEMLGERWVAGHFLEKIPVDLH